MTKKERQEVKNAVQYIRADWFVYVESVQQQAKLIREKYNALVESGFSNAEALEIIKTRGLN